MADKNSSSQTAEMTCIDGLTLVTFASTRAPTPELLAQLAEMRTWGPSVVGKMVIHQIEKYLAQHTRSAA